MSECEIQSYSECSTVYKSVVACKDFFFHTCFINWMDGMNVKLNTSRQRVGIILAFLSHLIIVMQSYYPELQSQDRLIYFLIAM